MGFMQRQVVFGTWVVVDCVDGVWTYPSDSFINVPVGGTQIDLDDCSDELYRFTMQVCNLVSLDNCDVSFIEIIEGSGHWLQCDNPQAVTAQMLRFLGEVEPV